MKLYAEEQIKNEIQRMQYQSENDWQHGYQSALNDILHVIGSSFLELPSDDEINDEWEVGHSDYQNGCNYGAKWMRDKIKLGNK